MRPCERGVLQPINDSGSHVADYESEVLTVYCTWRALVALTLTPPSLHPFTTISHGRCLPWSDLIGSDTDGSHVAYYGSEVLTLYCTWYALMALALPSRT